MQPGAGWHAVQRCKRLAMAGKLWSTIMLPSTCEAHAEGCAGACMGWLMSGAAR